MRLVSARDLRAALVALLVPAAVLPVPAASASSTRTSLSLDPSTALAGSSVGMSGRGFWREPDSDSSPRACRVRLDDRPVDAATCTFDGDRLTGSFVVPASTPVGAARVTVCRIECTPYASQASATLEVRHPQVAVPDLAERTREQAAELLGDAELLLGQVDGDGQVVSQSPPARTLVEAGSAVSIVLRPAAVEVPDLSGQTRDQAATTLGEVGLHLAAVTGDGRVVRQQPVTGTAVDTGSGVDVTLQAAPATPGPVPVPDLTGQDRADASASLALVGLLVGAVEGRGRVAGQRPRPGTLVDRGTAVDLTLRPVAVERVPVPDVVGQTREQAAQALGAVGLVLGAVDGTGRVSLQVPPTGASVLRGTAVDLVLTPATVLRTVVPALTGRSREEAAQALGAAGLRLGQVSGRGVVAQQQPAAGAVVDRGTAVGLALEPVAMRLRAESLRWPWAVLVAVVLLVVVVLARGLWPLVGARLRARRGNERPGGSAAEVPGSAAVPVPEPPSPRGPTTVLVPRPRVEVRHHADVRAPAVLREVLDLTGPPSALAGPAVSLRASADADAPVDLEEVLS